ncbi:DUF551 domain-containing protein [Salmonella enterica subsp. enterica]|nr:DUF551 domain-containing protein [Salmonella enterica subsp. enterica]
MTTITKEEVKAFIEQIESDLANGWEAQIFELKLARIALASLDAEPVAWTSEGALAEVYCGETGVIGPKYIVGDVPLYRHAQPAPVVPEECPEEIRDLMASHSDALFNDDDAQEIWNACRAAMLQAGTLINEGTKQAGNSPVTPDGWISCSERMPNDKDYVWCWGKSYGWTECDTFEGYYDWSRNKWWAVTDDVEEPA